MIRKYIAELIGTALLVYFGVGVATLSFGFHVAGSSFSAGVVATALAFGSRFWRSSTPSARSRVATSTQQ